MKEVILIILGLIGGILGTLFLKGGFPLIKKNEGGTSELEKKPAADIVDSLDNSGDVERIKEQSSGEFDNVLQERKDGKRKEWMDRFRG